MAEIDANGRTHVGTLIKDFKKEYGVNLRIYKSITARGPLADEKATLASIRDKGVKAQGDIKINGNMQVGNLEDKFRKVLGIGIQIENTNGNLANNKATLSSLTKTSSTTPDSEPSPAAEDKKGCMGIFLVMIAVIVTLGSIAVKSVL